MKKKICLAWLAAVLFLGAQAIVAQHEAEFGPEKHNHHGHPCDIQLFADHAKALSLPSLPAIPAPVVLTTAAPVTLAPVFAARFYQPALPRAPPISIV